MRILIISDTWNSQLYNTTHILAETLDGLRQSGHTVKVISLNDGFKTLAFPATPHKLFALFPYKQLASMIEYYDPEFIHIASDGSLGKAARSWCLNNKKPFTTTYLGNPQQPINAKAKKFHQPAARIMVSAAKVYEQLKSQGLDNVSLWTPGVDLAKLTPGDRSALDHLCPPETVHLPKFIYIGSASSDKNLEAFLSLDLPGTKWVVGGGEAHHSLQTSYPDATFLGIFHPDELLDYYRATDVFVLPSKSDMFALELLEAMACGTPVAAFPVAGVTDIVVDAQAGVLDNDLQKACLEALQLRRRHVRQCAEKFDWEKSLKQFQSLLEPIK